MRERSRSVAGSVSPILAAVLLVCTPLRAEDAQAAAVSKDSMREMAALVPEDTPIRKVHFPRFDADGKLQAIVDAAVMTKLDATMFSLQELSIRLYDAEGQLEMRLINPHAFYDLSRGLLFSLARTKIFRGSEPTPTLEGTGFVFDLERRVGRLLRDTVARIRTGKANISDENGPETALEEEVDSPPQAPAPHNDTRTNDTR